MYKIYKFDEIKNELVKLHEIDPNFIDDKNGDYFCIKDEDEIIGYALVKKIENNYLLERMFVKEGLRYKSNGTKILKFVVNHGRGKRINKIICNNKDIENFLKKYGFKECNGHLELDNIQCVNQRVTEGKKVVMSSIIQNIFLAILKITGGIFGSSRALISDGVNSLSDVGSSIAIYLGIYFSNQPADEEHPYGHEKIESIIGNMMGLFLLITAFELVKGSVMLLISGKFEATPSYITILWAAISMVVKFFMYRYKMRVGIETDNSALIADAKDSKSDVYSSGGVIIGILLSIWISPVFDIIVSIIVGILIFKEGVSIILETSNIILDKQDDEFIEKIENYIEKNTLVKNVHDVYMRKSGDKIFLSLHIRVPKDMTVYNAHNLADGIRESLILDFENIKDVMIHVDYLID